MLSTLTVTAPKAIIPESENDKAHHVGHPRTFHNPWPSAESHKPSLIDALKLRFTHHPDKTNIPLPEGLNGLRSEELVKVQKPTWGVEQKDTLRATWIGHASFLVETPADNGAERGIRILFDPVFCERMSPVSFVGPRRFTPTPCTVEELPEADIICISHNHYDHLDLDAIKKIYTRRKGKIHVFCGLGGREFFLKHAKCLPTDVTELDWWDGVEVAVPEVKSSIRLTCLPAQHGSRRGLFDGNKALWCSFAVEATSKKLFFAGDTGYQVVGAPSPCPVFKRIGELIGPFDLSLLPIGCFKPAAFMAEVHCSPVQSLDIHRDIRSKLSIGMHYMTLRGALSAAFEAVQDPGRTWREHAEKQGIWCGGGVEGDGTPLVPKEGGVGLVNIGETIAV
ncbi:hypothetical protein AMS68_004037 [Peltaster fructicola]|uniref:Metallo-beta-lactamase domain-containing protein n=1 Tax=Peltaster fructicola TaxID=286661 RepID=A0A6H0XVP8_9PEZI|nr:hypothetical protein AMS68_004037 [Peltaster fructicola]